MICTLTIVKYPRYYAWAGILSMALFRWPLLWFRDVCFWKLMGCGKGGSFSLQPDWQQWAILTITQRTDSYPINAQTYQLPHLPIWMVRYIQWFKAEPIIYQLVPIEGHGLWDGKAVFGQLPKDSGYDGVIAVLTRATIRLSKLHRFWQHVQGVANQMNDAQGFITSVGIGEVPFVKQATFSVWENKSSLKQFAYKMHEHTAVIQKTRKEKWYSEDMFVRFRLLNVSTSNNTTNPLLGKL
jgi:hypothetical protein